MLYYYRSQGEGDEAMPGVTLFVAEALQKFKEILKNPLTKYILYAIIIVPREREEKTI